ncbi:MAG: glycoside hydrolase, partial [Clostridia bacterium]|nr:glycoside hydrolase [Clostridia bacterium]
MKKIRFGNPEELTPVKFCKNFSYNETEVSYPTDRIVFKENARGCTLRLPMKPSEQIYGMGLQLKSFNLVGRKLTLRPNADPRTEAGDSHAPVPFFISTEGYGIFVDTARHAEFYFGSSALLSVYDTNSDTKIRTSEAELYETRISNQPNISIQIPVAKGVDIYIIEGKNITDIVAQYNMMSGGGCDV